MTTATQPGYELKLFGTPQLSVDGEPVRLTRRKAVALVAYLALSDRPQTRERLAALLWPEKQSARALASLRTVIHEITGLADILEIDQDLLSVKHDQCRVDVREFLELITKVPKTVAVGAPGNGEDRSEWIEAVDLYTDEFLRGFGLRDAPEFDDWIFFTAESLQTRLASSLASLVEHLTSIDTTAAILHAQRLVQIEELDEDNHRTLIELYVTEGRYSAAIRQFERCREVLARELQEDPSSDLVELYEALKGKADGVPEPTSVGSQYLTSSSVPVSDGQQSAGQAAFRRPAVGRSVLVRQIRLTAFAVALLIGAPLVIVVLADRVPVADPKIPSVMVLPFESLAADGAMEALARGLARYVETRLLEDSGLNVPRAGNVHLATRDADELRRLGRSEHVDFVLDGTVAGTAEHWSVALQLVDVRSGRTLYATDFAPSPDDLDIELLVIAQEVTAALYERLGSEVAEYLQSAEVLLNPNCEASGMLIVFHGQRDLSELNRARLYLTLKENLIADDYNCEGYFLHADEFWRYSIFGLLPPDGGAELMRIALDEAGHTIDLPETELTWGIQDLIVHQNLEGAEGHFRTAYETEESSESLGRWWSLSLALGGKEDEALAVLERSGSFGPREPSLPIYRATYLYWSGRYEESIAAAQESIDRNNWFPAMVQKGKALIQLGSYEEAEEVLLQAVELPAPQEAWACLGYLYAVTDRRGQARDALGQARHLPNDDPSRFVSEAFPAIVHMGMGDAEEAIECVRRAVNAGDPTVLLLLNEPILEPINDEIRDLIEDSDA